jgi:hypothetical protein
MNDIVVKNFKEFNMAQPISDYKSFFENAKQALHEADALGIEEDRLKEEELELEETIKNENKLLNDKIDETVKERRKELIDTYDNEIKKIENKLKELKSKRQDAREKAVKEKQDFETAHLYQDIKNAKKKIRDLCKMSKLPIICNSKFYYTLYFPRKLYEFALLLLYFVLIFAGLPALMYYFLPDKSPYYLIIIYMLLILIVASIYLYIGNITKSKKFKALKDIRRVFDEISDTKKRIIKIKKMIKKDKDDSDYNLAEYDFNISETEKDLVDTNIKRKEAINNFDNSTRHIIADEILTAAKPKIDELDSRRIIISTAIKRVSKELKDKNIYISENYEVYLGREFLDEEKIDALANIMDKAIVTNLREAIEEYRNSMEV